MSLSIRGAVTGGLGARPGANEPATGETRASRRLHGGADAGLVRDELVSAASGPEAVIDARIWNLLTGEERAFYLQHASNGPLTYAPATSSGAARPSGRHLGDHIDLRV